VTLLSVGDRVAPGRYRPFSRFSGALAFVREVHRAGLGGAVLACVVREEKGEGPLNIVVRGDLAAVLSLEVRPDAVLFGRRLLPIPRRFDSALRLAGPLSGSIRENLAAFRGALSEGEGAALLLRPARALPPSFQAELAASLREGYDKLLSGDLPGGAKALKGRGQGLTPSGDDLLAGFLLGLRAVEAAFGADLAAERRVVRRAARSRSLFSESFLRCAAEGRFFEGAQAAARALLQGNPGQAREAAKRLSTFGASSGTDLGVGLLAALELRLPAGQECTL